MSPFSILFAATSAVSRSKLPWQLWSNGCWLQDFCTQQNTVWLHTLPGIIYRHVESGGLQSWLETRLKTERPQTRGAKTMSRENHPNTSFLPLKVVWLPPLPRPQGSNILMKHSWSAANIQTSVSKAAGAELNETHLRSSGLIYWTTRRCAQDGPHSHSLAAS